MASILVATDFSELARSAYPHAMRLAKAKGFDIHLAHIVNYLGPQRHPMPGSWEEKATADLQQKLAEEVQSFRDKGIEATSLCRDGLPARELLRMLDGDHAFGVMATHRHGGFRSLLPGAVANKVIRHSSRPVMVVPEGADDVAVERMVMPVDFSELSTGAYDEALDLASAYGASLDLIHVALSGAAGADAEVAEQRSELEGRVEKAGARGVSATFHVEIGSEPAETICRYVQETGADLVVMPAHGYHGFSRLVLGSVTEEVIRDSRAPVLVLKPETTYADAN